MTQITIESDRSRGYDVGVVLTQKQLELIGHLRTVMTDTARAVLPGWVHDLLLLENNRRIIVQEILEFRSDIKTLEHVLASIPMASIVSEEAIFSTSEQLMKPLIHELVPMAQTLEIEEIYQLEKEDKPDIKESYVSIPMIWVLHNIQLFTEELANLESILASENATLHEYLKEFDEEEIDALISMMSATYLRGDFPSPLPKRPNSDSIIQ